MRGLNPDIFCRPYQKIWGQRGHGGQPHEYRAECVPTLENNLGTTGTNCKNVPNVPTSKNNLGTHETSVNTGCPHYPQCPHEKDIGVNANGDSQPELRTPTYPFFLLEVLPDATAAECEAAFWAATGLMCDPRYSMERAQSAVADDVLRTRRSLNLNRSTIVDKRR